MKKTILLFSLFLLFFACNNDNNNPPQAPPGPTENAIFLDGENSTAPFLPIGYNEAAVRFIPQDTEPYKGKNLDKVAFFIYGIPQTVEIRIYGPGTATTPGALLYSGFERDNLASNTWSEHVLSEDLEITGEDLWVAIGLSHTVSMQSIGCDAGPNVEGADWLVIESDNQWITYGERTSESVNWNIRAIASE